VLNESFVGFASTIKFVKGFNLFDWPHSEAFWGEGDLALEIGQDLRGGNLTLGVSYSIAAAARVATTPLTTEE